MGQALASLRRARGLLALSAGAAAVVAAEALRGPASGASGGWIVCECGAAAVALALAWRLRDEIPSPGLVVLVAAFGLALVLARDAAGAVGDIDVRGVYAREGNSLLHGHYPRSEYPPGAVALFAAEAWLGGGHTRLPNGFLMVGFLTLLAAALLAVRPSGDGAWVTALVCLWPADLFFWQYRFDLAPTALLVVGLVLAHRGGRWAASGAVLGLAAALKWTPALAALTLVVWLLAGRRARDGARHAAGFASAFVLVNLPFLLWAPSKVVDAYTAQGRRSLTAESFAYPPLRLLGLAHVNRRSGHIWDAADAPGWTNAAAVAVQLALVVLALVAVARARGDFRAAVAIAALSPCLFLLSNRVFSPQYAVTLAAGWAVALLVVPGTGSRRLVVGAVAAAALGANALVFPARIHLWLELSTVFFVLAFACSGVLLRRAVSSAPADFPPF